MATRENAPHDGEHTGVSLPLDWFTVGAKLRGYRVTEDGRVAIVKDGAVTFVSPPNLSNATVAAYLVQMFLHGMTHYVQSPSNINGKAPQDVVTNASQNGTDIPGFRSNDAFDAIFAAKIAELSDAHKGWTEEVVKKMTTEQKAERTAFIEANIALPDNVTKYYDSAVQDAITAGTETGEKRESKRQKKSKTAGTAL